ncbi:glycosyltransferase family 39 protein [Latilactobacillus sakei]|uniref:Glycosyltransferase RgtA/B/C/D-like domain-containing protein n=1 Tax=Latilactobacillus sakei TaxID=1599 RepID=A0AAX0VB11_LATSK|nr:glycosyltransferase family 39 protein [Latilactobacillus sakei]PKX71542.1 hypothetical protein CUR35_07035 [Latilactobacillus sakei]PKX78082.1 hypothetical protein CUR37_05195 [Latilactobacillus sakei]
MWLENLNNKITTRIIYFIATILWGSAALGSLYFMGTNIINNPYIMFFYVLLALAILSWILYVITKHFTVRNTILLIIVLSSILKLIWILKVHTELSSDFLVLYNASVNASKGDFNFMKSTYFQNWPYQLGFVLYQSFIIKAFGNSVLIIKLINILLCNATAYIIFLIGKKVFNEKIGLVGMMALSFYPQYIFFSSVLTNQFIANFLFYFGVYLIIRYNNWSGLFGGGVLIGLGNIVRPLGPLIIIAVFLYILFYKNLLKYKSIWLTKLVLIVAFLGGYQIITVAVNTAVQETHASQYPLKNRSETWKFVTGLNYETTGAYSNQDLEYLNQYPIGPKRDRVGKKIIKKRLADKKKLLKLVIKKSLVMWSYEDAAVYWSNLEQFINLRLYKGVLLYQVVVYTILLSLAVIGILGSMIENNHKAVLLVILMIGYFMVHWLIEIQTRYRFFIMPSILLFSSAGLFIVGHHLKSSLKK